MSSLSSLHVKPAIFESPRVKKFPKSTIVSVPFVYTPSDDGTDENLLILLHGLGDTQVPFGKLGKQLKLPQTATLALRAPQQIPYLYEDAFQWYPSFDQFGEVITRPNPTPAVEMLTKVLMHLIEDCAWLPAHIHLFGFAQGGSVAIETALAFWKAQLKENAQRSSDNSPVPSASKQALGSVVTVSGPPLLHHTLSSACPTPVFAFHRSPPSELALSSSDLTSLRKYFEWVKDVKLRGDGMPRSRDEWHPIMEFWSQRLTKRSSEDLYEVMGSTGSWIAEEPASGNCLT